MTTTRCETDMEDQSPPDGAEAVNLRFLRRLVTTLTLTMILGVALIVLLLAIRLNQPLLPAFPDSVTLPEDVRPIAFTSTPSWIAVVTDEDRILILDPENGTVLQEIAIEFR